MKTNYFEELGTVFSGIKVRDAIGGLLSPAAATAEIVKKIASCGRKNNKIILIGNGGSASIASHIATDFLRNCGIPAMTFNDASLLTCVSNDFGYTSVFARPLGILAQKGDILFAVSSSGRSPNILNAVAAAKKKGCYIVTLSGFSPGNPLRTKGNINFYVPSNSYGCVEITHLAICHSIVDTIINNDS
jgi:D-sedoheptulose 7-phosphate isomerase